MPTSAEVDIPLLDADQIAGYQRDGWVKIPGVVPHDTAAAMLEVARRYEAGAASGDVAPRDLAMWREWRFVARDDRAEPFATVAYNGRIGRNVSCLGRRGGGIRYWNDVLARKAPASGDAPSTATSWHQDFPNHPMDRLGGATMWLALHDVDADQGAMQFLSGSHVEGPLGRTYSSGRVTGGRDHLEQYPWLLERYERSGPVELLAGDATFHHPLVVHGTGPNTTDHPRWCFIVMYAPADALYTGATYPATDDLGLQVGAPFDHPLFPIVWSGGEA